MAVPLLGLGGGGGLQDALVVALVLGDYVVGAEFALGIDSGAVAHFAAVIGAGEDFDGVASRFLYITRFHQVAVDAVLDYFGDAAYVRGDYGDFAGHGFERGEAERLELRGEQEEVGGGKFFVYGILFTEEEDVLLELLFTDEV